MTGWFADLSDSDDTEGQYPWQPVLQVDGCCFPLPVWFATKAACEDFIVRSVVSQPWMDTPSVVTP